MLEKDVIKMEIKTYYMVLKLKLKELLRTYHVILNRKVLIQSLKTQQGQ